MPPPSIPLPSKCKRKKKDKPSEPIHLPSQAPCLSDTPVKRRPGRPLSTSATARALVKELAELHIGRTRDQDGGGLSTHSAFDPTLPAFPDVSAYVDGCYDGNAPQRSSQDYDVKQEGISGKGDKDTARTSHRGNKVAAKKHREIIKDRKQNASRSRVTDAISF